MYSVYLCPQLHVKCEFGEISTSSLYDILVTSFIVHSRKDRLMDGQLDNDTFSC